MNSLCSPGQPQTGNPAASTSQVLDAIDVSFCHSQPRSRFVWIVPQPLSSLSSLTHSPMSAGLRLHEPLPVCCLILFVSCSPVTESIYFLSGFISKVSQGWSWSISGIQPRWRCEERWASRLWYEECAAAALFQQGPLSALCGLVFPSAGLPRFPETTL